VQVRELTPGTMFTTEFDVEYLLVSVGLAAARVRATGGAERTVRFVNEETGETREFSRPSGSFSISSGTEVKRIVSLPNGAKRGEG